MKIPAGLDVGLNGRGRVITPEIPGSAFIIGSSVILARPWSVDEGAAGRWKSRIGIAIDAAGNALSDNAAADVIAHLVLPSTPANQQPSTVCAGLLSVDVSDSVAEGTGKRQNGSLQRAEATGCRITLISLFLAAVPRLADANEELTALHEPRKVDENGF